MLKSSVIFMRRRDMNSHYAGSKAILVLLFALNPVGAFADALPAASQAEAPYKIVFQITDSDPARWSMVLDNARNTLKELRGHTVMMEIVAYGPDIDMVRFDSEVADRVQQIIKAGVKVVICENTLKARRLTHDDMQPNLEYATAGVVELVEKQRAGYAYIRP